MPTLSDLLENNRQWAEAVTAEDPDFFKRLAGQQKPEFLWIGCSDSRVPANQIVGMQPGEVFVHRNVANLVVHCDMNLLAVLQFAVEYLKVRHVIVCGHYGCGGVQAALEDRRLGLIDNWLRPIRQLALDHAAELDDLPEDQRLNRLCELNVKRQAINLARTTVVQAAWEREQPLSIHGWIYAIGDGRLKDLGPVYRSMEDLA
ncbi:carbonate dehydratase [Wenzhouxiangella sp. AB-CW3]|uniref:carbonate dehydratase n=1 Tax=Wenzhouxiangella sp. AB-CW3 TaxID=2771012 RepID=UPI00168BA42E|nr:carbonate dehydratase [Wenzhouxiangella sp. AB-CW3]QOC21930.1 carbonate dehydratase [Wenzhouxiangella sp. AB-CW3]